MINSNIYHQGNKVYHHEGGKEHATKYYENIRERSQKQLEINIQNSVMKKRI